MYDIRRVAESLEQISQGLHDVVYESTKAVQPDIYHHGLISLPEHVIITISQYVRDDRTDRDSNPQLQFVCKWLRHIELNTPSLWTHISDDMSVDVIELRLERSHRIGSKDVPPPNMTFSIREEYSNAFDMSQCRCEALKLILEYSPHFVGCTVNVWHHDRWQGRSDNVHRCTDEIFRRVSFPNLLWLDIQNRGESLGSSLITRGWSTPELRHVSGYGYYCMSSTPVDSTVDTLWIDLREDDLSLSPLNCSRFTTLTKLTITAEKCEIRHIGNWEGPRMVLHPKEPIVLPNLQYLRLSLGDDCDIDKWLEMISFIRAPELTEYQIECRVSAIMQPNFPSWVSSRRLRVIFPRMQVFRMHVHSLDDPNVHTTEITVRESVLAAYLGPDTIFGELREEIRNMNAELEESENGDEGTGENEGQAENEDGETNTGEGVVNGDEDPVTENEEREDDVDQNNDTDGAVVGGVGVMVNVYEEVNVVENVKLIITTQGTSWPNFESRKYWWMWW